MKKHAKYVKEVLKKRKVDLSITEFQKLFNNEDACRNYLFKSRWPKGFICPKCGHSEYYLINKRHLYQCAKCKKQHSVTTGTIFQDTHLSLQKWFWAIYLISRDKRGFSALALKNAIQVSYPTAWLVFHKIRQAMANKETDYILEGTVIVDDAFFGGVVENKKRGRGTEKANVLVAISLTKDEDNPLFAKMTVLENMKDETVSKAIMTMVEYGSTIRSDAHKTIANLKGYSHDVVVASKDKDKAHEVLHWVDVIIANAKSYILGTYHGLPKTHLQKYLNEFCYRLNRRFCEQVIFDKLVNACIIFQPIVSAESTL
jgi:transposase-like protein